MKSESADNKHRNHLCSVSDFGWKELEWLYETSSFFIATKNTRLRKAFRLRNSGVIKRRGMQKVIAVAWDNQTNLVMNAP